MTEGHLQELKDQAKQVLGAAQRIHLYLAIFFAPEVRHQPTDPSSYRIVFCPERLREDTAKLRQQLEILEKMQQ